MIVENDRIGPLEKGDGFLSLVKVRIANTSDEVMRIDRLYTAGGGVYLDLTEEDLAVLGDMALPLTAEPHSIIEGWVPFRVREGREAYGIVFTPILETSCWDISRLIRFILTIDNGLSKEQNLYVMAG